MRQVAAIFRAQVRYWMRHRLQGALALFGIALGVAVFTAVRLSNAGALAAFAEGVDAFAGKATHRVYDPSGAPVAETWYPRIAALPPVKHISPALHGRAQTVGPNAVPLSIEGIDPLSEAEFGTSMLARENGQSGGGNPREGLERFLRVPGAAIVSGILARRLALSLGDPLPVLIHGKPTTLRITGVYPVAGRTAALLERVVFVDVSTFQEVFDRVGELDEIRLILAEGGVAAVARALPPHLHVEPIGARAERVDRMSSAFRLNLQVLGLFALLVAAFLIYNTAMFSVVQRERSVAVLRCIGGHSRAIFAALLLEAALLGAAGGALGILAGRWLALILVRGTQATLFEVILNTEAIPAAVTLDGATWAIGLGLGVVAALAGSAVPALEGARVPPLTALRGVHGTAGTMPRVWRWTAAAAGVLAIAAALLLVPSQSLVLGLAGATALVIGGALLSPVAIWFASLAAQPLLRRLFGPAGLLAGRNLARSISRTGMATASLMVALSLALAIEITVHSFRHTFELWLGQAITADVYIAPLAAGSGAAFPQDLAAKLRKDSAVRDVAELKSRRVVMGGREVLVVAIHADILARTASLPMLDTAPEAALKALQGGGAFVSETLALPLGLRAGGSIDLPGRAGMVSVPIAAVVQNYSVPTGLVYLEIRQFTALFGEVLTQQVGVWLKPGTDMAATMERVEGLAGTSALQFRQNGVLKQEALRVFDRTFAITTVMGGLASFVAFVAVVSALLALLEERMRILGFLRAIGVSRRRLGISLALEAALLAVVAGIVSWGVGWLMSAVLVFVVNRRAFGWSLQFLPGQGSYLQLLLLAIAAALLGSVYPIWRATRASVIATIREG